MRGVVVRRAKIISEDDRRKIISILNGELGVRDIHILIMSRGEMHKGYIKKSLGNHYHSYKEICYCMKGKALYKLRHELTGESMECILNEGEIMYRDAYITHTCYCTEDCILIDGSEYSWIAEEWNHYKPKEDLI